MSLIALYYVCSVGMYYNVYRFKKHNATHHDNKIIKIVNMKYNRIDIKWRLVATSFKIYVEILSNFHDLLLQHY
jgi:hypothetical protein